MENVRFILNHFFVFVQYSIAFLSTVQITMPSKRIFSITDMWKYVYDNVKAVNDSKLFAGLIVIVLNVSSKFTTVPISKTMESYLRNTFSKHILVFAIAWMGTRDIFIASIVLIVFTLLMQVFLNEQSPWCCLNEEFTTLHLSKLDGYNPETGTVDEEADVSKEELEKCIKTFEKVISQMKAHGSSSPQNDGYLSDRIISQTAV